MFGLRLVRQEAGDDADVYLIARVGHARGLKSEGQQMRISLGQEEGARPDMCRAAGKRYRYNAEQMCAGLLAKAVHQLHIW